AILQLALMAHDASARLHAIGVTLVRLGVTRRGLLEWETAEASAARGGPVRLRTFLRDMKASPLLAVAIAVIVAVARPSALPFALPIVALWAAAPWIACALSRPM